MLKNAFYIALFTLISWGGYQLSYPSNTPPDLFYDGIFLENVIKHVDHLTRGPRAVGEYYHEDAQRYLISELQNMGLKVTKHRTTSFSPKNRTAAPITNIMATYPGTDPSSKGLLLLSHYDAAKFSATGAGDDASGVAVILESINALIKTAPVPSNDILILFTDAEEIGLLGAQAFINERLDKYDIGLIINLEARGSSGPAMMWPETVGGNRSMIEAFKAASVPLPVTTSLHYEIYQMLPNDTDLTPFNQQGKINGFNFAFIDDHHNYHTQLDSLNNLSINTLAHQAIQVFNMVKHFSQADLSQLKSDDSLVYFSIPLLGLISYSTTINWLLLLTVSLVLLVSFGMGLKQQKTSLKGLFAGMIPLSLASILAAAWCWLMLYFIAVIYPETRDVLQGFPYQGHLIMLSLLISAAIITMTTYGLFNKKKNLEQMQVAVLLWLFIATPLVFYLPGAGIMLIPMLLASLVLITEIVAPKISEQITPIAAAIAFVLVGMLLINLPIALGIAALPMTAVLLVFILALFAPLISPMKSARQGMVLLLLPVGILAYAFNNQPTISQQQPHPTSMSYLYDIDSEQGYFYHYDVSASGWNESVFNQASSKDDVSSFWSKYKKPVRKLALQDDPVIQKPLTVDVSKPMKQGNNLTLEVALTAHHNTEILEIYTQSPMVIHSLSIEGRSAVLTEPLTLKAGQRVLHYYFDGQKDIRLRLELDPNTPINWQVQSHSTDLLSRDEFSIEPRPKHQIPKPFIKTDQITIVQSVTFGLDQ